ncbi:MAG TPA: S24/S26 family peptidase [Candidatus Binatia bacterium]
MDRTLYFHGKSMLPFLREGDEMVVEPVAWADIRIGDVITYRFDDKYPTRRVVRKASGWLELWCDNWRDRRFRAERSAVIGRVVARGRDGRWVGCDESPWRRAACRAVLRFYVGAAFGRALRMCAHAREKLRRLTPRASAM